MKGKTTPRIFSISARASLLVWLGLRKSIQYLVSGIKYLKPLILNTLYVVHHTELRKSLKNALVYICLIAIVIISVLQPSPSLASSAATIGKTSSTDFDLGTNSNLNTTSDEMKLDPLAKNAWYNDSWTYRKKITIDHTKVSTEDQTDFPVLINLATDTSLAAYAQDDGDDILITSDDEKTKLSHEIESFNGTTGALVLWVKVPSLSYKYDTTLYLYYGNAAATSQQNATDVWSNGYAGVWHLGEASGNFADSSGNGKTGTDNVASTGKDGKVGSGQQFDVGDNITTALVSNKVNDFTMSVWSKQTSAGNYIFFSNGALSSGYEIMTAAGEYRVYSSGIDYAGTGIAPRLNQWDHIVVTRTAAGVWQIYVNGASANITYSTTPNTPVTNTVLGKFAFWDWVGYMDEASFASTARSAGWIATEYANQNDPSTFYALGAETAKTSLRTDTASTKWYSTGDTVQTAWKYRRQITIDHTKVPNTSQSEFPMLVKITESTDPIFSKAQADGDDILFTDQYSNFKLSHEIETFDASGKQLWAWVKIPTLSTATDTTLWLYYGNPSASSGQAPADVWSNGYAGVWHMKDATTSTVSDSTSNGNTGSKVGAAEPVEATGKIGKSESFDGGNDVISINNPDISAASAYTFGVWLKSGGTQPSDNAMWVSNNSSYTMILGYQRGTKKLFYSNGALFTADYSALMDNPDWHYYKYVFSGTAVSLYIDGTFKETINFSSPAVANLKIGDYDGATFPFLGSIDDLSVATTARSADWIATEYNNQNAPETFASIDKEQGYYPVASTTNWYGSGGYGQSWPYRQTITIDYTKVSTSNQTDFPVLIKITDAANGVFTHAQSDGDDIVFTSSDKYTKLSHEIETFSTSSHELWAWVKIPSLSNSANTTIYMYYGNPTVASQQNPTNVWTNGYQAVYHLKEQNTGAAAGAALYSDSTVNNNIGNDYVSNTDKTGKVDGGQDFDGSNDYIRASTSSSSLNMGSGNLTVSGWFKMDNWPGERGLASKRAGDRGYQVRITSGPKLRWLVQGDSQGIQQTNTALSNGQWYYYSAQVTAGVMSLTLNGQSDQATAPTISGSTSNAVNFDIGLYDSGAGPFDGQIDETRVSNVARSAGWIATEYANQNDPATFYSIGSETADPGSGEWFPARGTWSARQQITIDHTKVPNTDQTDFPVLIKIANQSNGVFGTAQADGDDILFTSSNGTTKLSHEIETYDGATAGSKALWAWVKVPSLSHLTDTVLYLYYGNAAATSQQNATAVWSNGYAGVWHLGEASGSINDSTSNSNTGSSGSTQTVGKISKARTSGSAIGVNNSTSLNPSHITISGWINPNVSNPAGSLFEKSTTYGLRFKGNGYFCAVLNTEFVGWGWGADSTTPLSSGSWQYVAFTYDGTTTADYYNGSPNGSATNYSGNLTTTSSNGQIFNASGGEHFDGSIDDARISSTARSADWIATEYNNQNSPETFATFGMEQKSGSYASPSSTGGGSGIINTSWNGGWGTPNGFASTVTIPAGTSINYQMRSSAVGGATDSDWTAWYDLGTASSTGTFSVATAAMPAGITTGSNKYLQTKATMSSSDGSVTPTLSDYTIYYLADILAPTNPTVSAFTIGGTSVTTSTWTNLSGAVSATFSGSTEADSGLAGYYVYFGTNYSADPATDGVYQAHVGAAGASQTYTSSISTSDDGNYYFMRIKTKDIAGNISSAGTLYDFGYDISAPARPTYIAATPAGYTTTNSFSFTWPAGSDVKSAGGWYATGGTWTSRQQITFDHTKVPNTDQTDFPVLVKITDAENGLFASAQSDGDDILFTSQNGMTKLSHEIEKYDSATHELWAWVKLPLLSHSTDTKIYMYYGNSGASNQQNATDVWNTGGSYGAVWHLSEASGNFSDSTGHSKTGVDYVSATGKTGKIGSGQDLDGTDDYIAIGARNRNKGGISLWFKTSDYTQTRSVWGKGVSYEADYIQVRNDGKIYMRTYSGGPVSATSDSNWHRADITWDNTGNDKYYLDGNLLGQHGHVDHTQVDMLLGHAAADTYYWNGSVDEARSYDNITPSADWIATEFANQNSPETFMTVSSSGGGSDIKWYEYKRATDGSWSHTANASTRTVSSIQAYQEGANAFYVRTIDNAGNTSSNYQQVTYYYSGVAPAKPENLAVTPGTSDSNSFTFSWDKPSVDPEDPPVKGYYYVVNAAPTMTNLTYLPSTSDHVTIGPGAYATTQGLNTFYVLAVNDAGNYSLEEAFYASVDFTAQTTAPPIPTQVSVTDSSDSSLDRWMLTLQWATGVGQDPTTFDHYIIYRSSNSGLTYSQLATTTSTAYIDTNNLNNSTIYYYYITAVDNAGKSSPASSIVGKTPTGKYLTPPSYLSTPTVSSIKSNSANIAWTTNRNSTSIVRYGTIQNDLSASSGQMDSESSHEVALNGLTPGATYYYQVQSLDENRDYSASDAYSTSYTFSTLAAPTISNVQVDNITLTSADISWETTTVSSSKLYYGTNSQFNNQVDDISGASATKHSVKLSSLNHSTKYNFRLNATDIDGNNLTSDNYNFETLPMPKVENLKATVLDGSRARHGMKITWTTNVSASSIVKYSLSGTNQEPKESTTAKLISEHETTIEDLLDQATYKIQVSGRDSLGNLADEQTVSLTTPNDSRPPVISDISTETSNVGLNKQDKAQIVVGWRTDEPATSRVEYSTGLSGSDYEKQTSEDSALNSEHVVVISDLDPNSPYHIRINSKDNAGNEGTSEDQMVVSSSTSKSLLNILLETLRNTFGWVGKLL